MSSLLILVTFFVTSMALACPSNDRLCFWGRIIDSKGMVGNVKEVFSNGQASVYLDSYGTVIAPVATLGKGVQCHKNLCVKDRIIDSKNMTGQVIELFDNGQARVYLDNYGYQIRSVSSLGKGFRCIENVCINSRTIDSLHRTGKIIELFDNGKARVYFDNYGYRISPFSDIGIELKCSLRENCSCQN